MSEDTLLIQQTLAGDEQAFHRLTVKYQSAIYSLILSYVRNPDDAQEIMQDVFLKAYQGLSSLRRSERFRFWLYQLARNQCQDWKRKNQAEFQQLTDKIADGAYPVDELLILRETLAKIMQAIDELPETEKRILKERYLDDSSYAEMQAKHGLSYKALNMRLLRAKQKVRARVEELLAGIGIFSWQDALKKMLSGGVEAVKISAKVKIITIGIAAVLVLSGTGFILWYHQSTQEKSVATISQTNQQEFLKGSVKTPVKGTHVVSMSKPNQTSDHASKQEQQRLEVSEGKAKDIQPKIASGTETSKTDASKTTISPELEATFRVIKSYRDKNIAIGQLRVPLSNRFSELVDKEKAIHDAMNGTEGEEQQRLIKELDQVHKDMNEVNVLLDPLIEQSQQIAKEADEYVQAHYGMPYVQFGEIYSEIFYSWEKAQETK